MTNLSDCSGTGTPFAADSENTLRNEAGRRAVEPTDPASSRLRRALRYVALARPHHAGKNVLVIAGILLALAHQPVVVTPRLLFMIVCGLAATCLIASSNYVLNEILDADRDRCHPRKRDRPAASGRISLVVAYAEWLILGGLGLSLAHALGRSFFAAAAGLALMGILYNVPPVRLKDLPYLDVLSEAVNSPIRLMLGWALVLPGELPELQLILVFWMAGAFAMAWKRLRELRFLRDRAVAAAYRKSFAHYNEDRLKACMAAYALVAAVFFLAW